jgi:adenylate cyclase
VRYLFEDCALDTDRRELRRGADLVPLEPQVFDLLVYLLQNRERVISKDDVTATIWAGRVVSESALTTRINAARRAIGDNGQEQRLIKTLLRRGIRFVGPVRAENDPVGGDATETVVPGRIFGERPSIAVLPFINLSNEPEQEYFAIGMTEDIITALSQYRWFSVVAFNSVFPVKPRMMDATLAARELGVRYVLEGSVRKAGSRIRITGQLIEGASGAHLWASHFDRDYENSFGIQDEITESVVAAIEPEIQMGEAQRAARKPASNLSALDCCLRGMWHYNNISPEENRKALTWLRQSIGRDPSLSRAYLYLARALAGRCWFGFSEDVVSDLTEYRAAVERALALDDRDPQSHYALSFYSMMTRQHQQALNSAQRAIGISSNFALGYFGLGIARVFVGQFNGALDSLRRAQQLSPHDPIAFNFGNLMALAHYHLGQYEEAVECAERSVRGRRLYTLLRTLLASLGQLGRIDKAAGVLAEMARIVPADAEQYWKITNPYANPVHEEHLIEGLRKAGLPAR